jgi:hypothetical protein
MWMHPRSHGCIHVYPYEVCLYPMYKIHLLSTLVPGGAEPMHGDSERARAALLCNPCLHDWVYLLVAGGCKGSGQLRWSSPAGHGLNMPLFLSSMGLNPCRNMKPII